MTRFFAHFGGAHRKPDPADSLRPTSSSPAEQVAERLRSSEWGPGSDRTPTARPR